MVHVKNESSEILAASVSATKDTAVATVSVILIDFVILISDGLI